MPEYLAPGVYVEEVSSGIKPIEGVSTSTAGFLGRTERGPDDAILVTSFAEYQRLYGGFLDQAGMYLPYSVRGFFDNGGKRAYIARVSKGGSIQASHDQDGVLQIEALGRGRWGTRIYVKLSRGTQQLPNATDGSHLYRVTIAYFRKKPASWVTPLAGPSLLIKHGLSRVVPDFIEDFDNLRNAAEIEATVNGQSQLVHITRDVKKELQSIPEQKPSNDEEEKKQLTAEWPSLKGSDTGNQASDAKESAKKKLDDAAGNAKTAADPVNSIQADTNLQTAIVKATGAALLIDQKIAAAMTFVAGAKFDDAFSKLITPVITHAQTTGTASRDAANAAKAIKAGNTDPKPAKDKAQAATTAAAKVRTAADAVKAATGDNFAKIKAAMMADEIAKASGDAAAAASAMSAPADTLAGALADEEKAGKVLIDAVKASAKETANAIQAGRKLLSATTESEAEKATRDAGAATAEAKIQAKTAETDAGPDVAKKALVALATNSAGAAEAAITSITAWRTLEAQADEEDQPVLEDYRTALGALERVDGVSIVVAPEHVNKELSDLKNTLISSCTQLADRVVLLSVDGEMQHFRDPEKIRHDGDSSYAAFYHPWIDVADPLLSGPFSKPKSIPPIGHVAGIIARTDIMRGVHKAPANEVVLGAIDPTVIVNKGQQDILNPRGVNCIRDFRADNRGVRLWGARTMSSDPEWKYLNVRRLFLFIEESIDQGTQWVVFEPNSDPTWAAVRRNVSNFLLSVWRSGALMGKTPEEAFFVRCDYPTTMTEADIEAGRLICLIGVAPVRPAEFVIFRISQKTLDAAAS